MSFIFGEERFTSLSATRYMQLERSVLTDPSDSASVELGDVNSPEGVMPETLKALREQAKRRGRRTRKYHAAALKFKRAAVQVQRVSNELTDRYYSSLGRVETLVRRVASLEDDLEEAKAALEARNKAPLPALDNNAICVICLNNPRGTAFVPCGHIACCQRCADQLTRRARGRDFPRCPICRAEFINAQPLYYA